MLTALSTVHRNFGMQDASQGSPFCLQESLTTSYKYTALSQEPSPVSTQLPPLANQFGMVKFTVSKGIIKKFQGHLPLAQFNHNFLACSRWPLTMVSACPFFKTKVNNLNCNRTLPASRSSTSHGSHFFSQGILISEASSFKKLLPMSYTCRSGCWCEGHSICYPCTQDVADWEWFDFAGTLVSVWEQVGKHLCEQLLLPQYLAFKLDRKSPLKVIMGMWEAIYVSGCGVARESTSWMLMALLPHLVPHSWCIQGRQGAMHCSYFECLDCIVLTAQLTNLGYD